MKIGANDQKKREPRPKIPRVTGCEKRRVEIKGRKRRGKINGGGERSERRRYAGGKRGTVAIYTGGKNASAQFCNTKCETA